MIIYVTVNIEDWRNDDAKFTELSKVQLGVHI